MKDYLIVQNFVNTFNQLQTLNQLTLPAVIPFDYPAFATAKQIWIQNIHSTSEESVELRNKAQQLMRVLQYQEDTGESRNYQYCHKITPVRTENSEVQQYKCKSSKQQNLTKCRQPDMMIKITNKQKTGFEQTSIKTIRSIKQKSSIINLNISQQQIHRDENVDNSNFNHIIPYLKSVNQSKQSTRPSQPIKKIVELNKWEYKKVIPPQRNNRQTIKDEDFRQNIRLNAHEGICQHSKYQCCCQKNALAYAKNDHEKICINQFQIKSPNNQSFTSVQNSKKLGNRPNPACQRVQNNTKTMKIKQILEAREAMNNNNYYEDNQQQQEEILGKFAISKQKMPYKIFMNHSPDQSGSDIQVYYRQPKKSKVKTQNLSFEQIQKLKQNEKNSQLEILKQIQKIKQIQMQKQIQIAKIEQQTQLSRIRQTKMVEEIEYLKELEREKQIKRYQQAQNIRVQNKRQQQRRNLIQKERQSSVARGNNVLNKLKVEFSECNQQQDDDEKRVAEQIRQLESKLNQIVAHNRTLKTQQSHSPNARVVKLNLTPSRSNLHKNMAKNPKSPTTRTSVPTRSCRLLSKRIENASKGP